MDGQDNTQNDGGIQDLVNKLDMCIANFDGKRQVFENAIGEKIQALEKDRGEARELRLSLHQESGDTRNKKIDDVNQWLNQKALISGAPDHFDFSVLIVDDDLAARDSIRRALMSFGAKKQLIIDVQEAKNGREAVYLHLAGASFDIILMDSHMPIMTGREAIKKLRQMGVKSQIIGVSYQFEQPAFRGSSINKWIKKPLNFGKVAAIFC
ncbi:two-component response regulator ARR [Salix suchowensis]|nr:two-component response regulator ARR [Salix suchowensis]